MGAVHFQLRCALARNIHPGMSRLAQENYLPEEEDNTHNTNALNGGRVGEAGPLGSSPKGAELTVTWVREQTHPCASAHTQPASASMSTPANDIEARSCER